MHSVVIVSLSCTVFVARNIFRGGGYPSLPSTPHSLPLLSLPLPPLPYNQLGSLGERCKLPSGSERGAADERFVANCQLKLKRRTTTQIITDVRSFKVSGFSPTYRLSCLCSSVNYTDPTDTPVMAKTL